MSSILHTFALFLRKFSSFVIGLFHLFFGLFTRGRQATQESNTPGTEGRSFFTIVQLVSSQKPKGLKPFVLPKNVVLRQLEEARCKTTQGREMASSTNFSDPELGRCNVVNLRGSPQLSHPLFDRPELPMPSFSPLSSYAFPKHYSDEYVFRSSWPPILGTQLQPGKNSLPCDADLSTSLSSASLKVWTSSPQGKQLRSPTHPNCSYSPSAGENRFASPFGDRGSTYFAPYFKGVPSVASASDLLDFSVYTSSPRVNVDYSSAIDASGDIQPPEKLRFKSSTMIYDPAIREVFTLRPSYGTRTPGSGGRNFRKLVSSTPSLSSISSVSDWSPSGLFTSVGERTSSSPCTTHTRSVSALCISGSCDLPDAEIGGNHPSSVPRVSVRHVGFSAKKSIVPNTVSCPDIPYSIVRATTGEGEVIIS
ncbi:uncharacterized protein F5891DRAFT_691764 [Suillus fuscotomentosus]|uniref:Uncharacterized protein n=1 Tax=Suillus fuscotomentosus TaxID=1912939 RepID=A0AAD4HQP4_9AGAM|nr:uncharacterized protein F5891DRAFT_691764 [Suillus fuscotomentosus]KAG1905473.1 hypothetical protein F5891DRAFT_691764 [Suillus fuscotomentosus]